MKHEFIPWFIFILAILFFIIATALIYIYALPDPEVWAPGSSMTPTYEVGEPV